MTIQETIIEALKAVQAAHSNALAVIANLKTDKVALEGEVARLKAQVTSLRADIAHLESEAVKIVEPDAVRSLLTSLAQVITEGQHATGRLPAGHGSSDADDERGAIASVEDLRQTAVDHRAWSNVNRLAVNRDDH